MEKNLLKKEVATSILNRIANLDVYNKPKWGEMNATEMLLHCNSCNKQILEEYDVQSKKTTFKQYLLKLLALYIAPNFTKGLKSESRHIAKGKISDTHFEAQKMEFIKIIKQFPLNTRPLTLIHPAFGNISTNEWGIAAYKHMDHHLRQFGV